MVLGRKGSGKTTLVCELSAGQSRLLLVDPLREYSGIAVEVHSPAELCEYLDRTTGRWKIAYHNDALSLDRGGQKKRDAGRINEFDFLCRAAYEIGDCTFVVEETDWFCDPWKISVDFERLIKYGRHRRVGIWAVTRRPSEIHRLLTSQAWEAYVFTLQEPSDLDYIGKYVGPAFSEGLITMPPHRYRRQNLWDRSEAWQELTTTPAKAILEPNIRAEDAEES